MAIEVSHINESAYNEILRQVVAVIDKARSTAAKSVCTAANLAHWSIGKKKLLRFVAVLHWRYAIAN